jgi:tRNA threonylcarbamoyl adenosine modification protein (Sua5/YciO/YrdC/YwlC family)
VERIKQLRQLGKNHYFTLMCRDLSDVGSYAHVNNAAFRLLKTNTPGAYTFILPATHQVPRNLLHPKRKTIGIRIPDNAICQAILEQLEQPMLTVSLMMPGESPLSDPWAIQERLSNQVDLIIDGGEGGLEPTTVIDMTEDVPQLVRQGKAPII